MGRNARKAAKTQEKNPAGKWRKLHHRDFIGLVVHRSARSGHGAFSLRMKYLGRDNQDRLLLKCLKSGFAHMIRIPREYGKSVERKRNVGVKKIDSIADFESRLGQITAIEATHRRSATKTECQLIIQRIE
jgi:hypothetical protein